MLQTWHNLPFQWQKRLTVSLEREWHLRIWSSVAAGLYEHSNAWAAERNNHVPSGILTHWGCMQVRVLKKQWTWWFETFIAEFELSSHLWFFSPFFFFFFFADWLVHVIVHFGLWFLKFNNFLVLVWRLWSAHTSYNKLFYKMPWCIASWVDTMTVSHILLHYFSSI